MVLKALEIQGFKSFPDKTKITFDKGITAVVGPNGSGKSNISDAMRWVLGETSSKQLRGGGKMEDVIFGGTQLRNQMGFASVSLYIDNSDKELDIEQDEIIVTRKYYRSGDSEYAINGQNVRLKDIYEMFLDTGIGRDGYSIIGQGKIAEIVASKSADRREIFEEASGIAKYRYRKNEAERRLSAAEENLIRLRDILNELSERVGPLEKESEKAKKFIEFSNLRKELEITLWVENISRAKETLREHQRKIETAKADYEDAVRRLEAVEKSGEDAFLENRKLEAEGETLTALLRSITEEQGQQDAKIAVFENDILHTEEKMKEILEEIAQAGESSKSTQQEKKARLQEIEKEQQELEIITLRIQGVEETLEKLTADSRQYDEKKQSMEQELIALSVQQTDWKLAEMAARSAAETQAERLAVIATEIGTTEETLQHTKKELQETESFFERIEKQLVTVENVKSGLLYKLENRQAQLASATQEADSIARTVESAKQRISVLTDLEQNMDGFSGSVKAVMRAGQERKLKGLIGPVSSILQVKQGYEIAIETALGFALQNIVVENESAAKEAISFLKAHNAGRATFLPLDTIKGRSFDTNSIQGEALPATQAVQFEKRYENIVSSLLGRILLVGTINEASAVAKQNGYRYRVVTKDGQVVNAGGSFTGGSVARSAGLFSRKIEIEELKHKIEQETKKLNTASENVRKWMLEADKLKAEITATEGEEVTHKGDKVRCEVERARIENIVTQFTKTKATLQAEQERLQNEISENTNKAETAITEIKLAETRAAALEEEFQTTAIGDSGKFLEARNKLSTEQQELRMEQYSKQKDIEIHRASITQLTAQDGTKEMHYVRMQESLAQLEKQKTEGLQSIENVKKGKEVLAATLIETQEKIKQTQDMRMKLEEKTASQRNETKAINEEKEQLSRESARLEERKFALETEYDTTIAKLWEEYEVTLSEAATMTMPFTTVTELRRQVNEIRGNIKSLGNVNVAAIEEFEQVSTRYLFLKEQVEDVETSKAELMTLISGIRSEMETIFRHSFAEINKQFGFVFTELFGGGSAKLYLSEEDDILESGIEIEVAPPGKIIKNLTALSGGEQALVAISIYFAILAVNPAPFCVLDEIEAALDDVNVVRFASYLRRICDETQCIVITHRRGTMEEADVLYGVTMQEDGVSKILRLNANEVDANLVS